MGVGPIDDKAAMARLRKYKAGPQRELGSHDKLSPLCESESIGRNIFCIKSNKSSLVENMAGYWMRKHG